MVGTGSFFFLLPSWPSYFRPTLMKETCFDPSPPRFVRTEPNRSDVNDSTAGDQPVRPGRVEAARKALVERSGDGQGGTRKARGKRRGWAGEPRRGWRFFFFLFCFGTPNAELRWICVIYKRIWLLDVGRRQKGRGLTGSF